MGLIAKDDGWRIPDELWEQIEPLIPVGKPHPLGCHNPRVPNRDAMNGVLFVLRTGCQWNSLNATNICSSSSSHRRFQEWVNAGVFLELWKRGLLKYDELKGLDWSWLSLDGAMTKSPLGGKKTGPNPTDRAKKGTKRSLFTEANGIPLAVEVAGANRHDMKLVRGTFENIVIERPKPTKKKPQGACMDKGYDYDEVREIVKEFGFTEHIKSRGEEAKEIKKKAGFRARRWIVERTHSWLNRFRGILIRWNKKPENYVGMLHLVCGIITLRACGLLR